MHLQFNCSILWQLIWFSEELLKAAHQQRMRLPASPQFSSVFVASQLCFVNWLINCVAYKWRSEDSFQTQVSSSPSGRRGLNSGCQVWWQAPLPVTPSCQPGTWPQDLKQAGQALHLWSIAPASCYLRPGIKINGELFNPGSQRSISIWSSLQSLFWVRFFFLLIV